MGEVREQRNGEKRRETQRNERDGERTGHAVRELELRTCRHGYRLSWACRMRD